jgi:hypothetical protein
MIWAFGAFFSAEFLNGFREITHPQDPFAVIILPTALTSLQTYGCFFYRLSFMMRAYRLPNTPFNYAAATKPCNANSERIDPGFFMLIACLKKRINFHCLMIAGYPFTHNEL